MYEMAFLHEHGKVPSSSYGVVYEGHKLALLELMEMARKSKTDKRRHLYSQLVIMKED